MAKSKNSSPRRRRCAQTRDGSRQFFAEWKNRREIFPPCPVLKNSRANRDGKQPLWIFNHSSRAAPPILSACDAFEKKKICQHWVNTVVWCGRGLEVEGDISLRPSMFTPPHNPREEVHKREESTGRFSLLPNLLSLPLPSSTATWGGG